MKQLSKSRQEAEELYNRHAGALIGFAASIVGSADAEDVVAMVMSKALDSLALANADNQRAYLYQSVLNACRSHMRSQGRRRKREQRAFLDRSQLGAASTGPDLNFVLDSLSPRQQAVVHLTYWEELQGVEVAERLGISEGAVRRHLARAKDSLRRKIQ